MHATSIWSLITPALALALVLSPLAASAELPRPTCAAAWWVEDPAIPQVISDAPRVPHVLLPLRWERQHTSGGPVDELEPPVLTVEVRDAVGDLVEGAVAVRPAAAMPSIQLLSHTPRWVPTAPLEAGATYVIEVSVEAPPDDGAFTGCTYEAFTREVSVATAALEPASIGLIIDLASTDDVYHETFYGPCGDQADEAQCGEHPGVCCARTSTVWRRLDAQLRLDGTPPGAGRYHAVWATGDYDGEARHGAYAYPVLGAQAVARHFEWPLDGDDVPLEPDTLCVTATLYDLLAETDETFTACADPIQHTAAPPPADLNCAPHLCAEHATDPGVEPGPDAGPELNPEVADAVEGVAEGVADVGPGEHSGSRSDGCAASGTGPGGLPLALALALALALPLFPRARRARAARRRQG